MPSGHYTYGCIYFVLMERKNIVSCLSLEKTVFSLKGVLKKNPVKNGIVIDMKLYAWAGLMGYGSDVLGYDDEISTDHMWGPRFYLFLREKDIAYVCPPFYFYTLFYHMGGLNNRLCQRLQIGLKFNCF